jgi:hypothetical protein
MSVPGSEYLYSTHGFTLLAAVIEKVTGVPFNKVIRQCWVSAEYKYRDPVKFGETFENPRLRSCDIFATFMSFL